MSKKLFNTLKMSIKEAGQIRRGEVKPSRVFTSTTVLKSLALSLVAWESDWDLDLRIVCGCDKEMVIEHRALAGMTEDGWLSYTCSDCSRKYRINMPFLLEQPRTGMPNPLKGMNLTLYPIKQPHPEPDDDNTVTENRPDPQE